MKVIRLGAFETNSSSCHDLVLSQLNEFNITKHEVRFECLDNYPSVAMAGDVDTLANVFYTIVYEYLAVKKSPIMNIVETQVSETLSKYGVKCSFHGFINDFNPEYTYDPMLDSDFIEEFVDIFFNIDIRVDKSLRSTTEVNISLNTEKFMNYLFGDSYFADYSDDCYVPKELNQFPWESNNHHFYGGRMG